MAGIQGKEGAALLDDVDKLRNLSIVSQELSLPQIVVVGSQSSGKSSVLEAISGFKFPVRGGLCTQFATEVILRRSPTISSRISIKSKSRNSSLVPKREGFAEKWGKIDLQACEKDGSGKAQMENCFEDAKKAMDFASNSSFTEDILRVELSGPEKDHLTLVDLPGLIATTGGNSHDEGPELVKKLVNNYIESERTIILAVVPGKDDFENQHIFAMLKQVDQWERRTIVVITYPDEVKSTGGPEKEKIFQDLAMNKRITLKLGWHVLRNPNWEERERQSFERDQNENGFFRSSGFWNVLTSDQKGAACLKKRLGELLMEHISTELPSILTSITSVIEECKKELKALGPSRTDPKSQKRYLEKIVEKYADMVKPAIMGHWEEDPYFEKEENRLLAQIRNANDAFALALVEYGHKWRITATDTELVSLSPPPRYLGCIDPEQISVYELSLQVKRQYSSHRGRELPGQEIPSLVKSLFRDQASNWGPMAEKHVEYVFEIVEEFLEKLLRHVAGKDTSKTLKSEIVDPALDARRNLLLDKVKELVRPYTKGYPHTLNTNYISQIYNRHQEELYERNEQVGFQPKLDENNRSRKTELEMKACDQTVSAMRSYYDIALAVFMDNIATLAIDQCLLRKLHKIIPQSILWTEDDAKIALLASEPSDIIERRAELQQRLKQYEDAHNTIKRHSFLPLHHSKLEFSPLSSSDERKLSEYAKTQPSDTGVITARNTDSPSWTNKPVTLQTKPKVCQSSPNDTHKPIRPSFQFGARPLTPPESVKELSPERSASADSKDLAGRPSTPDMDETDEVERPKETPKTIASHSGGRSPGSGSRSKSPGYLERKKRRVLQERYLQEPSYE